MARSRAAFTLIEVLVVIAIIGILAGLLFPVFSQAKISAQKATSMSNLREISRAAQLYLGVFDQCYPPAQSEVMPVPPDWVGGATSSQKRQFSAFWANSLQPFFKNYEVLHSPASSTRDPVLGDTIPSLPGASVSVAVSYTYNGLLHEYESAAVARPASLAIVWEGQGRQALRGAGRVTPLLACPDPTEPCKYVPASNDCSENENGTTSEISTDSGGLGFNMYGGLNYAYCDGSARFVKIGVPNSPQTDPHKDPFARYVNNSPNQAWYDGFMCHPYLFRPDFDFANWDVAAKKPND